MKKLLIVATIPETLTAFFTYITRHFQAQGWQVDGMAANISQDAKSLELFDRVWDVEWFRNPLNPKNLLKAPQQIQAVFDKNEYDLVNVTTPVAAFVIRLALNNCRKQGKFKMIYTAQGFHFYQGGAIHRNAIFLTLEKLAGAWTDYLVVVNDEDKQAAKRYNLVPTDRVRLIPGTGLNIKRYDNNTLPPAEIRRVRQELGLGVQTPLFLSVAEFIPRKRHRDLLKAFARNGPTDVHLALAGDGIILDQIQQLASDLGIEDRVHFLGFRRDIPLLMRASTATILVSEQEGLPNCVMESLSMETPVIGTNIRGTRDLLQGGCGYLVELGDIQGLATAMAWMLDNPEASRNMAKQGRERIAEYEVSSILQQYESLYTEAVGLELNGSKISQTLAQTRF
ncbi:MAG: glycosyltransferase family 4 protein [Nostocaceae cyanobacterium]|nr:glycosyltransferase family 4 protein [Nostocaceae cyanobacterium]